MEDWKKGFYESLLRFVRDDLGKTEATEVTGFEQRIEEGYRWSEYTKDSDDAWIDITYRDGRGIWCFAEWKGDFGELVSRLT